MKAICLGSERLVASYSQKGLETTNTDEINIRLTVGCKYLCGNLSQARMIHGKLFPDRHLLPIVLSRLLIQSVLVVQSRWLSLDNWCVYSIAQPHYNVVFNLTWLCYGSQNDYFNIMSKQLTQFTV